MFNFPCRLSGHLWVSTALVAVALVAIVLLPSIAAADTENVVFTIDPSQSTLQYSTVAGIYGDYPPQSPGSDTSSVSGHFLVSFDPTNDTPTSIRFVGGDGYYQQESPMTLIGDTHGGALPPVAIAYNNLSFDFNSPVLAGTGGVFPATTSTFTLLSGVLSENFSGSGEFFNETGYTDHITAGKWTLAETGGAGSGVWSLSIAGHYTEPAGIGPRSSTETFTLNAVSTAHFGTSNVTTVAPTATQASVLGGSSTPGGVSILLNGRRPTAVPLRDSRYRIREDCRSKQSPRLP